MGQTRYQLIKQVYYEASELPAEQRAAFLEKACIDDVTLRNEVQQLFIVAGAADSFLEQPAISSDALHEVAMASLAEAAVGDSLPERIGRYRVVRLLGEGGMGSVYEAEQDAPHRRVALKVLRAGMATPRVQQRFQQEVEVLGRLQHPGIARIYEAGVAEIARSDGRSIRQPFFAMELIDGRPITEFATQQRLDVRNRLGLLASVCDAVQFGHQHGVIHRDLKPANILVVDGTSISTGDQVGASRASSGDASLPQPKIIDFGVARATNADIAITTLTTDAGQILGTLAYMSPEQVRGDSDAIDSRCDVYALGVLGYELLAGRLPYDVTGKVVPEAARIIRDEEPSRMSSISRVFRGDIETIFAKALEKEPARRYSSAAALAADIRRYLSDEPIIARPPTLRYQLGKFARRHKEFVAGLALVFVVLVAGVIGTTIGLVRATQRANEAKRHSEVAQQASNALAEILGGADPRIQGGGHDVRLADLLDATAEEFDAHPQDDVELYIRPALGRSFFALGMWESAARNYDRAYDIAMRQWGAGDERTLAVAAELVKALAHFVTEECTRGERIASSALGIANETLGPAHITSLRVANALGWVVARQGRLAEAEAVIVDALTAARRTPASEARDKALVMLLETKARIHEGMQQYEAADETIQEAIRLDKAMAGDKGFDALGDLREVLIEVKLAHGQLDDATSLALEVVAAQRKSRGDAHPVTINSMEFASNLLAKQHRQAELIPLYRELLTYWQQRSQRDPEHVVDIAASLASALSVTGQYEEAADRYQDAIDLLQRFDRKGDARAVQLWQTACFEQSLHPYGNWVCQALQFAVFMQTNPALKSRAPPATLELNRHEWKGTSFDLRRWDIADNATAPALQPVASGDAAALRSTEDLEPGLYQLRIGIPMREPPDFAQSQWIAFSVWHKSAYSIDFSPGGEQARWQELIARPPDQEGLIPFVCWRTGPEEPSRGPNRAPQMYGLVLTTTLQWPAGAYRWFVSADDGVRMWIDGQLVVDDWAPHAERTHTADVVFGPEPHDVRIEYYQGGGDATLIVTACPRDLADTSEAPTASSP